ncbi:MAG: hypothetical protein Kow0099_26830 [Candidatus Abyssubacteria bacterium]
MYLEFYDLKEKPFSLTPDPAFLYYSNAHKRAIAFLKYGLQESKGFLQLTGPVGSGKTTLLRAILQQLDERTRTAYVINPSAPFPDLLRSIMKDLEIPNIPTSKSKLELLDFFHDYLLIQMRRANPVIVIFDEAQNLSMRNLEEIRMLSNFETTKEKLLQIVFVGQPELIQKLEQPELRQLKQRIQVRYHLSALKPSEVKEYIEHRLHVAGSNGGIVFSDDACTSVYEFSRGIPRLINSVCDVALLIGYVNERKHFDRDSIQEAIREMGGVFEETYPDMLDPETKGNGLVSETQASDETKATEASGNLSSGPPLTTQDDSDESLHTGPSSVDSPINSTSGDVVGLRNAESASLTESLQSDSRRAGSTVTEPRKRETRDSVSETLNSSTPDSKENETECLAGLSEGNAATKTEQPQTGSLHSQLLKSITRRFRTGSAHTRGQVEARRAQLTRLVQKYLGANNNDRRSKNHLPHYSALEQQEEAAPDSCVCVADAAPCDRPDVATVGTRPENERFGGTDAAQESRPDVSARRGKRRWFFFRRNGAAKRLSSSSTGFRDIKVAVLFKNGRIVNGIAEGLDVKGESFHFMSLGTQGESFEDQVRYDHIMAARIVENFENGWRSNIAVPAGNPKGRQIIVTLLNGEVINGITLGKFDPNWKRFFVVSPNGTGEVCWVLVERSATAGISTESFQEGIYAEKYEGFDDFRELLEADPAPVCQNESNGDLYFALEQFACALQEYQKAREHRPHSIRLEFKISLAHMNSGIKFMKLNEFEAAKTEFEKASEHERLCQMALAKAGSMKKLLRI